MAQQMTRTFSTILGRKNSDAIARVFGGSKGNGPMGHIMAAGVNTFAGTVVGGIAGAAIGVPNDNIDNDGAIVTGMAIGAGIGAGGSALTSLVSTPRVVRRFNSNKEAVHAFSEMEKNIENAKKKAKEVCGRKANDQKGMK